MEGKTIECDKKNARFFELRRSGPLRLNAVASDLHKQFVVGLGFVSGKVLARMGLIAPNRSRERERRSRRDHSFLQKNVAVE
jgi:hypothetical protein